MVSYESDAEATRIATGGLASAFSAAVAEAPQATTLDSNRVASDWYVGINGVPVGPMRLATLRQKASQGSVSPDSLVWREGFEEWLPLGTYPELVAIVEEGLSSARASFTPPPVGAGGLPGQPGAVAIHTASQPDDPLAAVNAAGMAGTPGVVSDAEAGIAADFPAGIPRRGATPLAWVAVVVALLFGLTIGFVVFSAQEPAEPIVKYVEVPASASPSGAGDPGAPGPAAGGTEVIEESDVAGAKGPPAGAGGPTAKSGTDSKSRKGSGLSGLSGLGGVKPAGPSAGPGTTTAGAGRGKLDTADLQRTVARYKGSVKRGCWQPALQTRADNAPSSARVNVSITVSPTGAVTGASTSGDPKGYRGLASCISSRVRGWRFPSSSESTTVNVPFVFASQ